MSGKLYLIPTTIGTLEWNGVIPEGVISLTRQLSHFVVEELRTARRYLSAIKIETPIDALWIETLNEHTRPESVEQLLNPLLQGYDVGLLSEAGTPAVADPGALLVSAAHRKGIKVIPLVGPNSILLTLMASGLNGQNFAFCGYLPVKSPERRKQLRLLEQHSRQTNQTQLFIEAPYRNRKLLEDILNTCNPLTRLTVATELTTANELVVTKTIGEWKRSKLPDINKRNTVFALLA